MVDEQHPLAPAGLGGSDGFGGGRPRRAAQGVEERRRLEVRLALLLVGIGVVEQRRADADLGDAVLHADRCAA